MSHDRLISPLYARGPREAATEAELDEWARQAWHRHSDLLTVRLSEVRDDFIRQALLNEGARQHGARKRKAKTP